MDNENAASVPPGMAVPPPLLAEASGPAEFKRISHVGRVAISLFVFIVLGDYFLWDQDVGLSMALFVMLLAVGVCVNRPTLTWRWRYGFELGLLLLTSLQMVVRPSLSNTLVAVTLLFVFAGDTSMPSLRPMWVRWLSTLTSALGFIRTWVLFLRSFEGFGSEKLPGLKSGVGKTVYASSLAVLLAIPFGLLLGSGNAVLRNSFDRFSQWFTEVIEHITFPEFARILFWGLLATIGLVLLLPRVSKWACALSERELSSFAVKDIKLERLRSLLALLVVNGLFLFSNTSDVIYLWAERALPQGVGYSEYVHDGVWNLGIAVVLAALVITAIFMQDTLVTGTRWVKGLALLWIVQNLLLGVGVYMRIQLYVDAHWLTPKRVYVVLFLLLVAVGYMQLARQVCAARFDLKKLLLGNALAVFCLFFAVQFVNVPRLVADYNFRHWMAHPTRNVMNMDFGVVLGQEMIPLTLKVAESGLEVPAVEQAKTYLNYPPKYLPAVHFDPKNWQGYTCRGKDIYELLRNHSQADAY